MRALIKLPSKSECIFCEREQGGDLDSWATLWADGDTITGFFFFFFFSISPVQRLYSFCDRRID